MLAFIDNWRLAKKLLVAFALLGVLIGAMALNGFISNRTLSAIAARHVERGVGGVLRLADVMADLREKRIIIYSNLNAMDAKEAASLQTRFDKARTDLLGHVEAYREVAGEDLAPEADKLKAQVEGLNSVDDDIFALRRTGDVAGTLALIKGDGKQASRAAINQAEKLLDLSRARAEAENAKGAADAAASLWLTLLLSGTAFAGLAAAWLQIGRSVAKPMGKLASVTTALAEGGKIEVPYRDRKDELGQIAVAVEQFRLAAVSRAEADARIAAEQKIVTGTLHDSLAAMTRGDLTADIKADYPPAYAELKANFNDALASLRALIGSVSESTMTIRAGSSEIAQASENLARRTEANAASLEETSAAVTQMDGRLKASAASAGRTVERADGAISTVASGRAVTEEAVQAMSRVADSAKGIDSVIEGLDKIAFQTRVLAMNAAVEAGRAGEAGRGFAVVADLVSALAMRAEEEAGRARDQLTATQTDIVAAVEMVQKVDGALANISSDVGEVHKLLAEMAADNQAQSSAVTQISSAIHTMDQATQQNAAMVEETSAAARNLSSEVTALADQASRFAIGGEARTATPRAAAPRAASAAPAQPRAAGTAKRSSGYVSPVKPLPVAAKLNGNGADHDDWTSF